MSEDRAPRPTVQPEGAQAYYDFLNEPRYYEGESDFERKERHFVLNEVNNRMDKEEFVARQGTITMGRSTVAPSPLLRRIMKNL